VTVPLSPFKVHVADQVLAAHVIIRRPDMLPYDQIPKDRLAIGDLATPLDEELGLLNVNLAIWMARDDTKADASVTRAGNQVTDSIDAMLRQLRQLRACMAAEYREYQDVAAARADELLARPRQLQQEEDR